MWKQAYEELKDFILKNQQIQITTKTITIPQEVRQQFWQQFDNVRIEFVREKIPSHIQDANALKENLNNALKELTALLILENITLPKELQEYLQDPEKTLTKPLFDLLFDLLKQKIDREEFEQSSIKNITQLCKKHYQRAYTTWAQLAVIKLLQPDKTYHVPIPKVKGSLFQVNEILKAKDVPPPKETRTISLQHEMVAILIVPDYIIHSKRIGRYVAIKSESEAGVWMSSNAFNPRAFIASNPCKKREWIFLDVTRGLFPDILVYADEAPEHLNLIADSQKICRPEIVIQCIARKEWQEKEAIEKAKFYNKVLKPKIGTFIISKEPIEEKIEENIKTIIAGLDQSKLEPIVESLASENAEHAPSKT